MDVINELEKHFSNPPKQIGHLTKTQGKIVQQIRTYAQIDQAIVVLTDLYLKKSHIYVGRLGNLFGLERNEEELLTVNINSNWKKQFFAKIHPDDLLNKYILELNFIKLLQQITANERYDYCATANIRLKNKENNYQRISYQISYIKRTKEEEEPLSLALCLFRTSSTLTNEESKSPIDGKIINRNSGKIIQQTTALPLNVLLSKREKEILNAICNGMSSKKIADILYITINTVNRHRQNILQKLNATNSFEAIKIAKELKII